MQKVRLAVIHRTILTRCFVLLALAYPLLQGCAVNAPRLSMHADRYEIEVKLDPTTHELIGRTSIDLTRSRDSLPPAEGPVAIEVLLHPELKIRDASASGAQLKRVVSLKKPKKEDAPSKARRHVLLLDKPVDTLTVQLSYKGRVFQDISAGEKVGQIHNFAMNAHVGEDGIYLGGGNWYPTLSSENDKRSTLSDYSLLAHPVPGMVIQAGAGRDKIMEDRTGLLAWRSAFPLDSMVLVGGKHEVHEGKQSHVKISVHLRPDQVQHADMLIEAASQNIARYEPLIGPYPTSEFAIVDNFFSSGFAFPTFTLLSSAVINMGDRLKNSHGYLDHEMLHGWWGNGIHVDQTDGNWCEALASYGANYYGYVLDGRPDEARRKRRNYCHFLSRIKPKNDKPLGTYGQEGGCGRGIAYQKGAAVFHMLARKIGQDQFWEAMRQFTKEYVGRYASWNDIRRLCEEVHGQPLEVFFRQWVRSGGAPSLRIGEASFDSGEQKLVFTLEQGEPAFELDVPIRITHASGTLDVTVPLSAPSETISLPVDVIPMSVEADPDFHIFRRIPKDEIIPTTAKTRSGDAFVAVLPSGEAPDEYKSLASIFASSFEKDEATELSVGELAQGSLADKCVLAMGNSVRDEYVAGFLSAIDFPIKWIEGGFEFEGEKYVESDDSVLCTVRHPGVEAGGVTVLFANSEAGIPRAGVLPFYDHSLVIFKNKKPVVRRDFELRKAVRVDQS